MSMQEHWKKKYLNWDRTTKKNNLKKQSKLDKAVSIKHICEDLGSLKQRHCSKMAVGIITGVILR